MKRSEPSNVVVAEPRSRPARRSKRDPHGGGAPRPERILVVDIGGNNVKLALGKGAEVRKFPSGPALTARRMVDGVKRAARGWEFDVVSIGYPGPVAGGKPLLEPKNLGRGWVAFDFARAFDRPVKMINDAAMQALGSYEGGKMLFLGLGTGLGVALVHDNVVEPMEVAHLPYKKGRTFEDYVGRGGLERLGKKKWRRNVADVIAKLAVAMEVDYVVLGGGNAKKIDVLPENTRLGSNANAIVGGVRLWKDDANAARALVPRRSARRRPQRAKQRTAGR